MIDGAARVLQKILCAVVVQPRRREMRRVAPVIRRELVSEPLADRVTFLRQVRFTEEEFDTRPPVVIGRHLAVEAEHLRTRADEARGIVQAWEAPREHRSHVLVEEALREFEAGNEGRGLTCHALLSRCTPSVFRYHTSVRNEPAVHHH